MKQLSRFEKFNTSAFLEGKELVVAGTKYKNDEKFKGIVLTVLITSDKTTYGDVTGLNMYEKFTVKVTSAEEKQMANMLHKKLKINVNQNTKGMVWGDYKQNLVITTDLNSIKTYE